MHNILLFVRSITLKIKNIFNLKNTWAILALRTVCYSIFDNFGCHFSKMHVCFRLPSYMISCPKAALICQEDLKLSKKNPAAQQPVVYDKKDNSRLVKQSKAQPYQKQYQRCFVF